MRNINNNNRSLQCCKSIHVHLSAVNNNNNNNMCMQVRRRPRVAECTQHRLGLTTENGRLGLNLASLMASL